jgi:hypothetical protein
MRWVGRQIDGRESTVLGEQRVSTCRWRWLVGVAARVGAGLVALAVAGAASAATTGLQPLA